MSRIDSQLRFGYTGFTSAVKYCRKLLTSILMCALSTSAFAQSCPDLRSYYPSSNTAPLEEWTRLLPRLTPLLESCLDSAEYFALLGAVQLNNGSVVDSMESLERAILLDPSNGAARIDYAEALFLTGNVLAALEINASVMDREDVPANVAAVLRARQRAWQQLTRSSQFLVELTGGYDSNLNGAPSRNDVTLTLEGTSVALTLDPRYRAMEGSFAGLRLGKYWQSVQATNRHDLMVTASARNASRGDVDLAQADWRYSYAQEQRRTRWELGGGTSHMLFGGNPLYSVAEANFRLYWLKPGCQPLFSPSLQHLIYHQQRIMDGTELGLGAGIACNRLAEGRGSFQVTAGYVGNRAVEDLRPGGDRQGWRSQMSWQWLAGVHTLSGQLSYTALEDKRGYSPLLANGAAREVDSMYLGIRYRRQFAEQFAFLLNLGHQRQKSNLEPFNNRGTVVEAGLSLAY